MQSKSKGYRVKFIHKKTCKIIPETNEIIVLSP